MLNSYFRFAFLAFFLLPASTSAQVPSSEEAGRQSQRFEQETMPTVSRGATIRLPGNIAPEGAAAISVHIAAINFTGNTVFSNAVLEAEASDLIGQTVSLASLYDFARTLTAKYGDAGYVLSRALVPPQELDPSNATLTIQIAETYIDQVIWPESFGRYHDLFSEYTAKITAERPTNINTMMRYLLLAEDLPGIENVSSNIQASETNPQASTLIIEANEKPIEAFARLDNRGTTARGPWQYLIGATFSNLLGGHEAVGFTYGGATEFSELQHAAANYEQVLTSEGLTAFANFNYSRGEPGTATLQALDFETNSHSLEVGFHYPIIRSREENLTIRALLLASNSTGQMLGTTSSEDRLRGVRVRATYDLADELNGTNRLTAELSQGIDGLGSTTNANPLASRESGQVDFTKLEASASRLQQLGNGFSVLAQTEAQLAFTPLLSPEECGYGGGQMGRAFDPSEITGDSCLLVSGELRFDPDIPNNPLPTTQLYAFGDYGYIHRIAPSLGTPTNDDAASAGLGIRFGNSNFSADLSLSKPLFGRADTGWRSFLTLSAQY